jgi:hypothetical protein
MLGRGDQTQAQLQGLGRCERREKKHPDNNRHNEDSQFLLVAIHFFPPFVSNMIETVNQF